MIARPKPWDGFRPGRFTTLHTKVFPTVVSHCNVNTKTTCDKEILPIKSKRNCGVKKQGLHAFLVFAHRKKSPPRAAPGSSGRIQTPETKAVLEGFPLNPSRQFGCASPTRSTRCTGGHPNRSHAASHGCSCPWEPQQSKPITVSTVQLHDSIYIL